MSRTSDMNRLRATLRAFCPTGSNQEAVTVPQLADALGMRSEEKQRLRKRIGELLRRGEVRKVKTGWYVHVPENEPSRYGESYGCIWRAVHVQRGAFTVRKISQISRYALLTVGRYLSYLEKDGFIAFAGMDGRARSYEVTPKGLAFRDIPYPPSPIADPTEAERIACRKLMQLYLEDVSAPAVLKQIRENLITLNARFTGREQENTHVEQED
jgi:hypothetical protein